MKQTQGWMTGLSGECEEARRAEQSWAAGRPQGCIPAVLPLPEPAKQGKGGQTPRAFSSVSGW